MTLHGGVHRCINGLTASQYPHIDALGKHSSTKSGRSMLNARAYSSLSSSSLQAIRSDLTLSTARVAYDILGGMRYRFEDIIYDQGHINACTANAMAFILRFASVSSGSNPRMLEPSNPDFIYPSRSYHYYNSIALSNQLGQDLSGDTIGPGVTAEFTLMSVDAYGTCPELNINTTLAIRCDNVLPMFDPTDGVIKYNRTRLQIARVGMPYSHEIVRAQTVPDALMTALFTMSRFGSTSIVTGLYIPSTPDPVNAYRGLAQRIRYQFLGDVYTYRFTDLTPFMSALRAGHAIFLGTLLYDSFLTVDANVDPKSKIPKPLFIHNPSSDEPVVGGHAMVIIGYGTYNPDRPNKNYFKVANSWGVHWSDSGCCYLDEDYVRAQTISAYAVWLIPL